MDPPTKQERNAAPQKSKDDELSSDQLPVGIRQRLSASERAEIQNFVDKLNTDVKFEIKFLVDIINYQGKRDKEYPFKSLEALEDFTRNWLGLNIPKMEMLTELTKLKEKYRRRAKQKNEALGPLEDNDEEAFMFGTEIWGSEIEDEYATPQKSKDDELSSDQVPVGIRQRVSASERVEINSFVDKLNTDVKFEIKFLVDMINYQGNRNKEYPFKSLEALEDFTRNRLRLKIPKMEMLTQLTKLKEKYRRRAKQKNEALCPLEDDDKEAFLLGTAIWGSETEDEHAVTLKSKDNELSSDQVAEERAGINSFIDKLNTDVKFEILFLVDMINYQGNSNKEYPFKSLEALDDFIKNWLRMNIPKMEMLTQLIKLKEKYRRRAKQRDEALCPLEVDDEEAFMFGTAIWGSVTEDEYADDEIKNTKKKSQVEGPGIGQDQDPNV